MSESAQAKCDEIQPLLIAAEKEIVRVYNMAASASENCGVSDTIMRALRVSINATKLNMRVVHNTLALAAEDAGATPQSGGQDKDVEDDGDG